MDKKKLKKVQAYIDDRLKEFDFSKIESLVHRGKQFDIKTVKIEYNRIEVTSELDESIIEDQMYQGVLNLLNQLNDMDFLFTWVPDFYTKGSRNKNYTFHQITTPYREVVFALTHDTATGKLKLSADAGSEIKTPIIELN